MEYFVISAKFVPLKYYTLSSQLRRLTSFSVGLFGSANSVTRSYPVMRKSCIFHGLLQMLHHEQNCEFSHIASYGKNSETSLILGFIFFSTHGAYIYIIYISLSVFNNYSKSSIMASKLLLHLFFFLTHPVYLVLSVWALFWFSVSFVCVGVYMCLLCMIFYNFYLKYKTKQNS